MRQLWLRCNEGHITTTRGKCCNNRVALMQLGLRAGRDHDRLFKGCHATQITVGATKRAVEERTPNGTSNGTATFGRRQSAGPSVQVQGSVGSGDSTVQHTSEGSFDNHDGTNHDIL